MNCIFSTFPINRMRLPCQRALTMTRTPIQVQPPLEFIPPALTPWVVRTVGRILPFWLKTLTPVSQIEAQNIERLVELYREFQAGKTRFLIAFRHPNTMDP